jgi:Protein of unknown function (DUF2516)
MSALAPLNGVVMVLALVGLGLKLFALVDAVVRPERVWRAVITQPKAVWVAILAVAALTSFFGFFAIIGLVAALVYLLDVRPKLRGGSHPTW